MDTNLIATASISVNATPTKVWEALTNPEMIKQYLFGTQTVTDWKVGSPVTYRGEWQGKTYEDKGVILQNIPEKLLQSTYWSSMSGTEDNPKNYATVTFTLQEKEGKTELTVTQDNNATEESRDHSEKNWNQVLNDLKKLVEK